MCAGSGTAIIRSVGRQRGWSPVYGTIASRFNDDGVTALFHRLKSELRSAGLQATDGVLAAGGSRTSTLAAAIVPASRRRYLSEIAESIRAYHQRTGRLADEARRSEQVRAVVQLGNSRQVHMGSLAELATALDAERDPEAVRLLEEWESLRSTLSFDRARGTAEPPEDTDSHQPGRWRTSLSGTRIPPRGTSPHDRARRVGPVAAGRAPPRALPLHRRRLPVQAGRRGPGPHVRGRG